MEWLIAIGLIWLIVRTWGDKGRIKQLGERLRVVESRLNLAGRLDETSARRAAAVTSAPINAPPAPPAAHSAATPAAPTPTPTPSPRAPAAPSALEERWRRLERLFMENWTGILGVAVVVAGVTFIGIYTALRLAPFYRFLMMVGVAALLGGTAFWLRRFEHWQALSEWLRSAAAAIFLFACAASGGLPGLGLQWIDAPGPALALLAVGISVNLYLSWASAVQTFAWLHVVLSMLPLAIVPQSDVSLGIASIVALFGVALSFRARWDQHLLIVIGAYVLYHVAWYLRLRHDLDVPSLRLFAAANAIAVFATAALVHYRKDYASQKPETWPLLVHISNWGMLGLSLFLYRPAASPMRVVVLVAAGVAAYALARRARQLGVRWLHVCDTLTGQALVVAGLANLYLVVINVQFIMLAIFLECLLFLRLVIDEGEDSLGRVGWFLTNCAAALFALGGLLAAAKDVALGNANALVLLVGAAAATAAHVHLARTHAGRLRVLQTGTFPAATMGWLVGAIAIIALVNLAVRSPADEVVTMETVALIAGAVLLLVSRAMMPAGLLAGSGAMVIAAHLISWWLLLQRMPWEPVPLAGHVVPLGVLAAAAIWLAGSSGLRQLSIYLAGIDLALAAYLFFNPVSPVMPCVAWLLLSMLALELANRIERPSAVSALLLGYGYVVAFVLAYALVVIQTQAYVGPLPARMLIELFALAVIAYWWFSQPREAVAQHSAWLQAHPFFLELGLIALAVTNVVEVQAQWRPLTWSLVALCLLVPPAVRRIDERLQLYSVIFFWASVANVALIMSTFESPSAHWYDRPDLMSLAAIALQVAYVAASHSRLSPAAAQFPGGLGALDALAKRIAARRNLWVYYPFFAGLAMFLFWRFDRSLLTLLWVVEAFAMFVLSAVLRENQFRHVALAGLAICVGRLLLVDLAEADLGLRGLIFLGVGLLMLGMNAIYNRYRARFQ